MRVVPLRASCACYRARGGERYANHDPYLRTKPYTPKTNGKVERFVQTSLREWAYARPYRSSALRELALQPFIHHYNWHRPHSALAHQPPMIWIPAVNDLVKLNT